MRKGEEENAWLSAQLEVAEARSKELEQQLAQQRKQEESSTQRVCPLQHLSFSPLSTLQHHLKEFGALSTQGPVASNAAMLQTALAPWIYLSSHQDNVR